jgi:uncharacterized membrane protein
VLPQPRAAADVQSTPLRGVVAHSRFWPIASFRGDSYFGHSRNEADIELRLSSGHAALNPAPMTITPSKTKTDRRSVSIVVTGDLMMSWSKSVLQRTRRQSTG